jgi:uncharacterized membrane protein
VGTHEENGILAKAQTEMLQRLMPSADHVRGNDKIIRKVTHSLLRHAELWMLF